MYEPLLCVQTKYCTKYGAHQHKAVHQLGQKEGRESSNKLPIGTAKHEPTVPNKPSYDYNALQDA